MGAGVVLAIAWLEVAGVVQALARASAGWGVGDCHRVEDMKYLECLSGSTVPNCIQMGVVCFLVVALFCLAMVARSSLTRAGLVLISFKNARLGFMMGPGVLAIEWPERF